MLLLLHALFILCSFHFMLLLFKTPFTLCSFHFTLLFHYASFTLCSFYFMLLLQSTQISYASLKIHFQKPLCSLKCGTISNEWIESPCKFSVLTIPTNHPLHLLAWLFPPLFTVVEPFSGMREKASSSSEFHFFAICLIPGFYGTLANP